MRSANEFECGDHYGSGCAGERIPPERPADDHGCRFTHRDGVPDGGGRTILRAADCGAHFGACRLQSRRTAITRLSRVSLRSARLRLGLRFFTGPHVVTMRALIPCAVAVVVLALIGKVAHLGT